MASEINTFFKIWSTKINDFFTICPKSRINNVVNNGNYSLDGLRDVRGIRNLSLEELKDYRDEKYVADILTTKLVKEKIDNIGIGYNGHDIYTNDAVLYDSLNFFNSTHEHILGDDTYGSIYSTYSEIACLSDSTETTKEENTLIANNSDKSISIFFR